MNNSQKELIEKINKLKKEKNAVILAHCYQRVEIDEVADYVGDSLFLSQKAAETDADIIVFAGVYFMAETAKILSPEKKVLLPRMESGCQMADMVNAEQMREFKAKYPGLPVVCYVNSSAEVKSECDICCTSSNSINVVKSLGAKKILFAPDTYLGTYVGSQLPDVEVIPYPGYCPTHLRITPEDIQKKKEKYPNAMVLVHPECHQEVVKMADYVGSTSGIIKTAKESEAKTYIIVTEKGVVERLQRDIKDKEFILASEKLVCHNMKWNQLEDILRVLEKEENEVIVDEEMAQKAFDTIDKMVKISG